MKRNLFIHKEKYITENIQKWLLKEIYSKKSIKLNNREN